MQSTNIENKKGLVSYMMNVVTEYVQVECKLSEISKVLNDVQQKVIDIVSYDVFESDKVGTKIVIMKVERVGE